MGAGEGFSLRVFRASDGAGYREVRQDRMGGHSHTPYRHELELEDLCMQPQETCEFLAKDRRSPDLWFVSLT